MPKVRRQEPSSEFSLRRFAFPLFVVGTMLVVVAWGVWDLRVNEHPELHDVSEAQTREALAQGEYWTWKWVGLVIGVMLIGGGRLRGRGVHRWL